LQFQIGIGIQKGQNQNFEELFETFKRNEKKSFIDENE
jgi:hypothetical protein